MDAEIGVRNLADFFRYNVLPDVVTAMGLADAAMAALEVDSFDDLPEYEKLAMLVSFSTVPCMAYLTLH
jgi:nitric oxide synthase oxygenase domain/subunit